MEKVINAKVKIIKLEVDYYQLVEILKYTECGNQLEVRTNNKRITWYLNGQQFIREHYTEKNKLNGLCESWYSNGQLQKRKNYTDGKLNGLYELWHPNGSSMEKRNYVVN
jgi:antitoxin component YwqK of YwqJK toxin-antitoxin module